MAKIITVKADKERHLKLGVNGLIQLEEDLKKPISELSEGMGMKDFRAILYLALKWEDKELTYEQTGELMDLIIEDKGFEYLGSIVGELIQNAMGVLPSN